MKTPEEYAQSNTEHAHQVALFMWASHAVKLEPRLEWLHAIPNGGLRDKITGGRLKAEGVKEGVSDVFLPVPIWHEAYPAFYKCGLYIEMKRIGTEIKAKGQESKKQEQFRNDMIQRGYKSVLSYGWYHAVALICNYLSVDALTLHMYVSEQYDNAKRGK